MMDNDLIERLAREAGLIPANGRVAGEPWAPELRRFAALVADACAKVAEDTEEGSNHLGRDIYGEKSAAAIRAKFGA